MVNTLRLTSGLVIFSFVCCHLINHIFGLISIEFMERARAYLLWFWRTSPGSVVFVTAAVVHLSIALRSIYIRRTLRLPAWEWAQMVLGLAIPFFLLQHVLGTKYLELAYGIKVNYPLVLTVHWALDPISVLVQMIALCIAWTHGCIGLHFWLKTKEWYPRVQSYLTVSAIMIPTMSLAGYISAGNRLLTELETGARSLPQVLEPGWVNTTNHARTSANYPQRLFCHRGPIYYTLYSAEGARGYSKHFK